MLIRRDLAQLLRLHIGALRVGPLFASRQQGSGPTPYVLTCQRVGRGVAGAAGISNRVYPHLFRHAAATCMPAPGTDITDPQRLLGHGSITTTRLYTETMAATLQRRLLDSHAHFCSCFYRWSGQT